jgi:hypothetical protein
VLSALSAGSKSEDIDDLRKALRELALLDILAPVQVRT